MKKFRALLLENDIFQTFFILAIIVVVCAIYVSVVPTNYLVCVGISVLAFASLSTAWNIIGGYAGQNCWCLASFMAMGSYSSVMLYYYFDINPWLSMWVGVVVAAIVSVIIGTIAFKHRGIFFTLLTTSCSEIIRLCLIYFKQYTGGSNGLWVTFNRKKIGMLNLIFSEDTPFFWIMMFVLLFCLIMSWSIKRSKLGYYLRAIGSDQDAAQSLGIDIRRSKLLAFLFASIMASIIGTVYGFYLAYIDPTTVAATAISTKIGAIAIVGGVGTLWGPPLGALILIPLSEISNKLLGASGSGMLLYGLTLVIVIIARPMGIISFFQKDGSRTLNTNPLFKRLAYKKEE